MHANLSPTHKYIHIVPYMDVICNKLFRNITSVGYGPIKDGSIVVPYSSSSALGVSGMLASIYMSLYTNYKAQYYVMYI